MGTSIQIVTTTLNFLKTCKGTKQQNKNQSCSSPIPKDIVKVSTSNQKLKKQSII